MKKILLLFVLFLGLNVGAFAATEILPPAQIAPTQIASKGDAPVMIIIRWKDGGATSIWDGSPCISVYNETGGGGTEFVTEIC